MSLVRHLDSLDANFGAVITTARQVRTKEWNLLFNPELRKAPSRVHEEIRAFSASLMKNKSMHNELACLKSTPIASLKLRDDELDGEEIKADDVIPAILKGRLLVGQDTPHDELPLCSQYSVSIESRNSEIKKLMRESVPNDILTRSGDNKASLANRLYMNKWLDELHKHSKGSTLVNGDTEYKCPMRRTVSVCLDKPYKIENVEDRDHGKSVTAMYSYICPEMPVTRWMCRPMKQLELAFALECWEDGWPYYAKDSRRLPPNWMQVCVYHGLLKSSMGQHRDNYDKAGLARMRAGLPPYDKDKMYAGVKNSQVHGTNVIVYTMGNSPMEMVFSCPNINYGIDQNTDKYITVKCYSIKCREGHLSILDPLDDVMMCHGVKFEALTLEYIVTERDGIDSNSDVENAESCGTDLRFRVAFVMRTLENVQEFYVDTSTIRLSDEMTKAAEKSNANNSMDAGVGRNAYD